jgi:hypothetical protein
MHHINSFFRSDLDRYYAQADAADSRADAVDVRMNAIAAAPNMEQFADAFCAIGTGKGDMQKLLTAYTLGRDAFMSEVFEQLNAGFADVADLEIEEQDTQALECNAREVLSDWD